MKTFINRFRWLYAGAWIGFAIAAWAFSEAESEKKTNNNGWAGNNPSKMDDIFNHYKEKANA